MIKKIKMTLPMLILTLISSLFIFATSDINVNASQSNIKIPLYPFSNNHYVGFIDLDPAPRLKNANDNTFYELSTSYINDNFSNGIKFDTPSGATLFIVERLDANDNIITVGSIDASEVDGLAFFDDRLYAGPGDILMELGHYYSMYFVVPDMQPVINGETAFVTNVDDPYTVDEIKSHLEAHDNEDGDISHLIVVEDDDYTANNHKTGTYQVIYSVTDSAGNKATLTVHVLIRDVTSPVITGQSTYTQSMTSKLSLDTILSNLSVTDNYDNNLSIDLSTDNYTSNYNKPGTHTVNYQAIDTSGNTGTFRVTITVIDDVKPTISGPTTIVKGQMETLTTNDVLSQLTANDNHDGNLTDHITVVENNYIGNGDKVGSYTIIFQVQDNAGNKTNHTVTITVKDDIPPVFYVDNYFITVSESINLSQQDFIDLLTATGQINVTSTTTFTTILDEYTGNENKVGMYAMTFKTASVDGNEETTSVVINVTSDDEDGTIIDVPLPNDDLDDEDSGFFQTIWNAISTFFGWIWSGLKWVGNGILWLLEWFLNLFK